MQKSELQQKANDLNAKVHKLAQKLLNGEVCRADVDALDKEISELLSPSQTIFVEAGEYTELHISELYQPFDSLRSTQKLLNTIGKSKRVKN